MRKLFFGFSLVLSATALSGQDAASVASEVLSPRRVIKTNLVGYALFSINANYEQKVGKHTTVGMLGGYKLPSTYTVDAIGELDGENQTYTGEIEPQGYFVNPYFRYYTKKALTGFYVEAFTRYYDYNFLLPYDYDKDGRTIRANLDGTATGFGGGLALGVQIPLAPRIYLDLNAGMGVGIGDVHLETNDPNLDADDYQTIKQNLDDYADDADVRIFFMDKTISSLEADADASSAWADITGELFPLTRAGIAIGFAF
jgi:hypothetical protein